jgi:hypothetical protein
VILVQNSACVPAFYTDMIKTLRITSVVAAILAGIFFVFPVVYGVRSDKNVDEFLKLPSVKEKFESASDSRAKTVGSRTSPLVEQAEAFASYLNPSKTTAPKPSITARTTIDSKLSVTPKFRVFATSVCATNPQLSLALIDEPGKGRYWVRQSDKVGHLLVDQVKDGFVVIKGSEQTFQLKLEEKSETGPLNTPLTTSLRRGQTFPASKPTISGKAIGSVRRPTTIAPKPQANVIDDEKAGEFVNKLKDLQKSPGTNQTDSGLSKEEKEERDARIQELISKFKAARVGAEESKKLGNMGEELKDKNSSDGKDDEGKTEDGSPEPNAPPEEE